VRLTLGPEDLSPELVRKVAVLQVRAAYLSQDGRADRNWAMPRPHYRAVGRNRLALVN